MEIGISTASYFPFRLTEACFAEIRKAGALLCEVFLESYHEYSESFRPILLKNQCIDVHSVHAISSQFEAEIISKNPRAESDSMMWFETVCRQAQAMGAKAYTYHGPMCLKRTKYHFDFDHIGARIQKIADIANSCGMTLCYENVHYAFYREPSYFAELKKRVPNLGACLDIKQAMQSGFSWRDYFEVTKDRIKTIHLCDFDADGRLLFPGEGGFDFVEFFKVLKGEGVDAPCMLEVYAAGEHEIPKIKSAYEYLLECRERA